MEYNITPDWSIELLSQRKEESDLYRKDIETFQNTIAKLSEQAFAECNRQREEQIIQALKDHGYDFETKSDLYRFAQDRMSMVYHPHSYKRILCVDNIPVIEYWETSRFEQQGNTFRVIVGEPPW